MVQLIKKLYRDCFVGLRSPRNDKVGKLSLRAKRSNLTLAPLVIASEAKQSYISVKNVIRLPRRAYALLAMTKRVMSLRALHSRHCEPALAGEAILH